MGNFRHALWPYLPALVVSDTVDGPNNFPPLVRGVENQGKPVGMRLSPGPVMSGRTGDLLGLEWRTGQSKTSKCGQLTVANEFPIIAPLSVACSQFIFVKR